MQWALTTAAAVTLAILVATEVSRIVDAGFEGAARAISSVHPAGGTP